MSASSQRLTNLADSMLPPPGDQFLTKYIEASTDALSLLGVTALLDSGTKRDISNYLHHAVLEMIEEIESMEELGASNGYFLPDDPFVELRKPSRKMFKIIDYPQQKIDSMYESMKKLVEVYSAWKSGEIDLTDKKESLAQISSFDVSVDGFGSSGDPLSDILGYESDADVLKRSATIRALSELDFSKRKPTLVFIADIAEKASDGIVVAWKKMNDAVGYYVKRRNVFTGQERKISVNKNPTITTEAKSVSIDAVSFYDDLNLEDLVIFEDKEAIDHSLFAYSVSAYQTKIPVNPSKLVNVKTSSVILTEKQINDLSELVLADSKRYGRDSNEISPYPALSSVLYGDSKFGWMISAVNVFSRIEKNEDIRNISYLGSSLDLLVEELNLNKILAPDNTDDISNNLEDVIGASGVQSAILAILDLCGITLFISNKDDPSGFQTTQEALEATEGPIKKIISSIDPETATLDPVVVISNLSSGTTKKKSAAGILSFSPIISTTKFIDVIGRDLVDLTTSDGIGRFVDIIRSYYDVSFVRV